MISIPKQLQDIADAIQTEADCHCLVSLTISTISIVGQEPLIDMRLTAHVSEDDDGLYLYGYGIDMNHIHDHLVSLLEDARENEEGHSCPLTFKEWRIDKMIGAIQELKTAQE
jgi:hypothetical protein